MHRSAQAPRHVYTNSIDKTRPSQYVQIVISSHMLQDSIKQTVKGERQSSTQASLKALWQRSMAYDRLLWPTNCTHGKLPSALTLRGLRNNPCGLNTSDAHTCTGVHPYDAPSLMPKCWTCQVCVMLHTAMFKAKTLTLHTTSPSCVCIDNKSCVRRYGEHC